MPDDDVSKLKIDKTSAAIRTGRRKRRVYWILTVFLLGLAAILYYKGFFTPSVQVEAANVSQIYPSQTFTLLNASGYVAAQRKAAVASKITARLVLLTVEEGSYVKEGQVIARLESDDVVSQQEQAAANLNVANFNLEQAKAELKDATLTYNRDRELIAQGYVSQAEYDASEARYRRAVAAVAGAEAAVKAASAALRGARISVEYTLIRAPFDAVVLTKNADVGDIVTPVSGAANAKAAVVTIADMDSLQVEADVSESNLSLVKVGQPCEIQLDAIPDSRFQGAVHMIVPTADRSKATVMIKVRFLVKDRRILPEMSAKVAFLERPVKPDEQKPRTALNPASVVARNGSSAVFLIRGDRVVETPVTLGARMGDVIEVLNGVKAGDRVVLKPLERMKDGKKVKVAET
jgi:RND family efflux transporter MFP subunit